MNCEHDDDTYAIVVTILVTQGDPKCHEHIGCIKQSYTAWGHYNKIAFQTFKYPFKILQPQVNNIESVPSLQVFLLKEKTFLFISICTSKAFLQLEFMK